jgi:hypothetical protein
VAKLRRIAFGPLSLGRLAPGAFRELRADEVAALRKAVGEGRTRGGAKAKASGREEPRRRVPKRRKTAPRARGPEA